MGVAYISDTVSTFLGSLKRDIKNAVDYAVDRGVFVVVSAGNDNGGLNSKDPYHIIPDDGNADGGFLSGLDNVITVGATVPGNAIVLFSNVGNSLDIAAPGASVRTPPRSHAF